MNTDSTKWLRLTKDQLKTFDIPSYEWEVVLIKEGTTAKPTDKDLHFNAQEYFSEEELSAVPVFQPMKTDTPPKPAHENPTNSNTPMTALPQLNTELALGGKIYWRDLSIQLSQVWWELSQIGGNLQHGDLDYEGTAFSVVLPLHGEAGRVFHAETPMDAWRKAKTWLMSPSREFAVELPITQIL